MSIFWKIAENKIKEWLDKPEEEKQKTVTEVSVKDSRPYESYLLDDIFKLIRESVNKPDKEREVILKKAYEMEIKLLMSYENSGFPLMARITSERIREYKASHLSLES